VQIAAQRIDLKEKKVVSNFNRIIIQCINRYLSQYFIDLTHITQKQLEEKGKYFTEVWEAFSAWSNDTLCYSYSKKLTDHTDTNVIKENIRLYDLSIQLPLGQFHTWTELFQTAGIDTEKYNSRKLHQAFDVSLSGHEHKAMHDVNSLVASIFALDTR